MHEYKLLCHLQLPVGSFSFYGSLKKIFRMIGLQEDNKFQSTTQRGRILESCPVTRLPFAQMPWNSCQLTVLSRFN